MNDALDQLHAQFFALSNWVVTLATLHPACGPALLSLPQQAQAGLLFAPQEDAQIERCVEALKALNQAFVAARMAMAEAERLAYSPKS
jgi:hypothetical protein